MNTTTPLNTGFGYMHKSAANLCSDIDEFQSVRSSLKFLDAFLEHLPPMFGSATSPFMMVADVVFLLEDNFLKERLPIRISRFDFSAKIELIESRVAAKHSHDPVYNTISHELFQAEDGALIVTASPTSNHPFVVWIRPQQFHK